MITGFSEERFLDEFQKLLAIDSVTGQYRGMQDYLTRRLAELGYEPRVLHKGGLVADLGGEGAALVVCAHADTIGAMVRHINADGTIKLCPVGGFHAYHAERENIRLHTRSGKLYTGTIQRKLSSTHVTPDEAWNELPDFDKNLVAVLDADVASAQDVRALGVEVGDYIVLEPRFAYENGYIKSHYIDDKALLAILLEAIDAKKKDGSRLRRKTYLYITFYEEIGHGASWIPVDTKDFIALDIACVGPEQMSNEHKVSIFCKDSRFPYHIDLVADLERTAREAEINYVPDIFTPHYGTDGVPALQAGHDIRHGAFGPGVLATHGYERTHMDAIRETWRLLTAYLFSV